MRTGQNAGPHAYMFQPGHGGINVDNGVSGVYIYILVVFIAQMSYIII